ncbi:MAG: hypothetical protein U9R11_02630 [Chloroflexota bacterium]|nr:hypothetical protein [Chloroflexota bacterium]
MANGSMQLVVFLSILNVKITEYFVTPLFEALNWNKKYQLYVSLVTGLLIAWATKLDVITPVAEGMGQPVVYPAGMIITGVLVGGGANLIYDVFDTVGAARELREAEAERIRGPKGS